MKTITIPWLYEIDKPFIISERYKKLAVCNEETINYAKNIQMKKYATSGTLSCKFNKIVGKPRAVVVPITTFPVKDLSIKGAEIDISMAYHDSIISIQGNDNLCVTFIYNITKRGVFLAGFHIVRREDTIPVNYVEPWLFG